MPIDEGIKDTVIALQLLGLQTTSSHEGKLGRHPIPYIDIESMDAEELQGRYHSEMYKNMPPEELQIKNKLKLF